MSRSPIALHRELDRVWRRRPGWRGVLADVNHSAIGLRFMATAMVFFAIGGVLAMLLRAQLASPRSAFVGPEVFNQLFTMHGSIMMFLFAIPLLEGMALYLLPKLLGSRDMAFPRLSSLGYWCYVMGGMILLLAMVAGVAPDSGWFMYTPLSDRTYTPGINADVWLLGVTFVEISALCAAAEIMVSILKLRAEGMRLMQMPLMAWYLLGAAAMMLVGFPPLILGSILLEVQRAFDWPFFEVARGGDPVLWQHLFWLFGHPEVYIIFLPGAGVLSTLIPVVARRSLLAYGAVVAAILATVFLSFGLWVHHMFTIGIPHLALAFFSIASALVAVPTAVQVFIWIGTLWQGRPRWSLPMLWVAGFFLTFVFGGLTGVMLAAVPFNWQAHDTAFVTAHLHYVLVGGFFFPMMAGLYHWLPSLTGRGSDERLGVAAFWLTFAGFHLTFLGMHLTGLLGMARRVDVYPPIPAWEWLNLLSSVGGFVMAFGVALLFVDVFLRFHSGRKPVRNPQRATTLEWTLMMPAPSYNIASLPRMDADARDGTLPPQRIDTLAAELAGGHGLLPGAPRGVRETLVVDALSGKAEAVAELPGNTVLPFVTASSIAVFFGLMLAGLYGWAAASLLLVTAVLLQWPRRLGRAGLASEIDIGGGRRLPVASSQARGLGWWGSRMILLSDATLYASLLFVAAYLAVIAPNWDGMNALRAAGRSSAWWLLPAVLGCAGLYFMSRLPLAMLASVLAMAIGLGGFIATVPGAPDAHALFAVRGALVVFAGFHLWLLAMLLLQARLRPLAGHAGPQPVQAQAIRRDWARFTAITTGLSLPVLWMSVL